MRICFWPVLIGTFLSATASAQDTLVGPLSNPETWRIEGLDFFTAQQIKRSLAFDYETLLATHPQAPLADLPKALQQRIQEGYRHTGFLNAAVTVDVDESREVVRIAVQEGIRCTTGHIVVKGVDESLSSKLRTALTKRQFGDTRDAMPHFDGNGAVMYWVGPDGENVDDSEAVWLKGRPVPSDERTLTRIRELAKETIQDEGFVSPQVDCELTVRASVADLIIDVKDLGTPLIVSDIEIRGNARNSDDEILQYLKLEKGEGFTGARRRDLLRRLWESGRFAEHRVDVETHDVETHDVETHCAGATLKIAVAEAPWVPPLSQPLNEEAVALLKCREWMTVGPGSKRDLVVSGAGSEWELIVSKQGLLGTWCRQAAAPARPDFAFRVTNEGIALYDLLNQRKLEISDPNKKFVLAVKETVMTEGSEQPFKLVVGLRFSRRGPGEPPLDIERSRAPAFYAAHGSCDSEPTEREGNLLLLHVPGGLFRLNVATGELIEQAFPDCGVVDSVKIATGRFETRSSDLASLVDDYDNEYDSSRPISSLANFLFAKPSLDIIRDTCGDKLDPEILLLLGTLPSLIDHGVLRQINDDVIEKFVNQQAVDGFGITAASLLEDPFSVKGFARISIGFADDLFPRDSWPWVVWREFGFKIADGKPFGLRTVREVARVFESSDCGPLAYWLAAEWMTRAKGHRVGSVFARRGAERLDRVDFHRDLQVLLGNSTSTWLPIMRWLDDLSAEERTQIAQVLSVETELLDQLLEPLRNASDEQAPEILFLVLDELWVNKWRSHVDERLREIDNRCRNNEHRAAPFVPATNSSEPVVSARP